MAISPQWTRDARSWRSKVKACTALFCRAQRIEPAHVLTLWQENCPARRDQARREAAFDKPLSAHIRFGNLCSLKCK